MSSDLEEDAETEIGKRIRWQTTEEVLKKLVKDGFDEKAF